MDGVDGLIDVQAFPVSSPFYPKGGSWRHTRKLYLLRLVPASAVPTAVLLFLGPLFMAGLRLFAHGKLRCLASFLSPYHLRSRTTQAYVLAHRARRCVGILGVFAQVAGVGARKECNERHEPPHLASYHTTKRVCIRST